MDNQIRIQYGTGTNQYRGWASSMFELHYSLIMKELIYLARENENMSRKRIFFIFVILLVLSVLPPLLLSEKVNAFLVTSSAILGGLVSIITVTIAFLLYNKFGIDEVAFDKKVDTTLQLLQLIQSKKFWIRVENARLQVPLSIIDRDKERLTSFRNVGLLFCMEYYDYVADIYSLSDNYYLPKEIAEKIKAMEIMGLAYPADLNVSEFGRVEFASISDSVEWGLADNKEMLLKDFVNQWIELVVCIKAWIKKHSLDEKTLNIQVIYPTREK